MFSLFIRQKWFKSCRLEFRVEGFFLGGWYQLRRYGGVHVPPNRIGAKKCPTPSIYVTSLGDQLHILIFTLNFLSFLLLMFFFMWVSWTIQHKIHTSLHIFSLLQVYGPLLTMPEFLASVKQSGALLICSSESLMSIYGEPSGWQMPSHHSLGNLKVKQFMNNYYRHVWNIWMCLSKCEKPFLVLQDYSQLLPVNLKSYAPFSHLMTLFNNKIQMNGATALLC